MRVLFDHQIFSLQRYGGISRSFASYVAPLRARGVTVDIGCYATINKHLDARLPRLPARFVAPPRLNRSFLAVNRRATALAVKRCDVVHTTFYLREDLGVGRERPMVVTVHDMIPERFPDSRGGANQHAAKMEFVAAASAVVCVSEHTRRDLMQYADVPAEKAKVVHHGIDLVEAERDVHPVRHLPARYVLYVGHRHGYKNFAVALDAFIALAREHPDVHLVCVGGPPFNAAETTAVQRAGLGARVRHTVTSDAQLRWLYRNAAAFVFPSRYEGFGLPILEAFAQNCPVVAARASCFPEIAADAAVYFDADDVDACAGLLDDALQGRLRHVAAAGRERCAAFTLAATARGLAEVYEMCVGF